ncbi:hypothetical protein PR048_016861 [Dryococelus australis]|uniref:Reverse transcriptase domain-containing protein n=1 Tax=Dryococelus australis TaxID=614101 RepID=A0ABQ9H7Z8_9NEOP|nr:hypothetical protein PR048_016861 [Dryococelus australis]
MFAQSLTEDCDNKFFKPEDILARNTRRQIINRTNEPKNIKPRSKIRNKTTLAIPTAGEVQKYMASGQVRRHILMFSENTEAGTITELINGTLQPIAPEEENLTHRGGAVAMAVRKNIKHKVLPVLDLATIEALAVPLTIKGKQCTIVAIYAPSGKTIEPRDHCTKQAIISAGTGDLNAKHSVCNSLGRMFYNKNTSPPYMLYAPYNATHNPDAGNRTQDILDITLYRNTNFIYDLEVTHELHSDHLPVITTLKYADTEAHPQVARPNYHKANWPKFNAVLHDSLNIPEDVHTAYKLEDSNTNLTKAIHTTVQTTNPHRARKTQLEDFLLDNIKNFITHCNRFMCIWHQSNFGTQSATVGVRKSPHLKLTDNSLWHTNKKLTRETLAIPPIRDSQNSTTSSLQEKSDWLVITLETDFKPNDNPYQYGIPQGSILSPMLFNIYAHDFAALRRSHITCYTYDIILLASSTRGYLTMSKVQEALDLPGKDSHKIPADLQKPLLFAPDIEHKSSVKYLGVNMDTKLTWSKHIAIKDAATYSRMARMYPLLNVSGSMSLYNLKILYMSCIRPILIYAALAWGYDATHISENFESQKTRTFDE